MGVFSVLKKIKRQKASLASSETGFTLIEMLIVVAIMGIAALIAIPNYLVWESRSELRQAVTEVQNQLLLARMAALSRNAPVTVAISITNGAVLTTTTNAATGAQVLASTSVRLPHVVDLKVGPSAAWTSAATANVSFNSRGMRSGGPGPTLNQELAMVTPRGIINWCQDSVCS
jgi:type IV fimbrial biogenesis protein FimT